MSTLHERLLAELDPTVPWDSDRDERAFAALRAVVELHPVVSFGRRPWCEPCARPYPCSTIQAIARELGVSA